MPDNAPSVLRRKLAPPRPRAVPGQDALFHMLSKTMPRDADRLLGMQVTVTRVAAGRIDKDALIAGLASTDLIFLMLSDSKAPGLCTLSAPLLAGLIEIQMSGRVASSDVPDRVPTPVDGIISGSIVDRWIASAKDDAADEDASDWLPFSDHVRSRILNGARNADLALDPVEFDTLSISLDLAGGARTGTLFFAIPVSDTVRDSLGHNIAEDFRATLMTTPTELPVVLARLDRPLRVVQTLSPGDILDVPISALGRVTLEDASGKVLSRGRLGQLGGKKAIRLSSRQIASDQSSDKADFRGAETARKGAPRIGLDGSAPLESGARPGGAGLASPKADAGQSDLPELPELPGLPEPPDAQD